MASAKWLVLLGLVVRPLHAGIVADVWVSRNRSIGGRTGGLIKAVKLEDAMGAHGTEFALLGRLLLR